MGTRTPITWILMGTIVVLFGVLVYMSWNMRATRAAVDSANRLCGSVKPGMSAEDVAALVNAVPGAHLIASPQEVSADFGRCLCFVPIENGRATSGMQVGCKF
jgi:hypothetical protein